MRITLSLDDICQSYRERMVSGKFAGSHDIFTPSSLVEEILCHIPFLDNGKKILVMYTLEFALNLVYTFKVDPKNIYVFVDHELKKKWAQKLGVNIIETLENLDMKFDCVLANPPYQAAKGESATIWDNFVIKGMELAKDGGMVSMIHPPAWRKPGHYLWKIMTQDNQLVYVNINGEEKGNKIFNAGTRFDYYLIKKEKPTKETLVIDELGAETSIDLIGRECLPNFGISIWDKITGSADQKLLANHSYECSTLKSNLAHADENHPYPQLTAMSKTGVPRYVYSKTPHTDQYTKKVIFSDSRFLVPLFDVDAMLGASEHGIYIKVQNNKEGENLVKYLKSDLIQFVVKATKWGNFQMLWTMFKYIDWPFSDFDEVTDDVIYSHFGITEEEIEFIEKQIR